jgi:hypothetical protein
LGERWACGRVDGRELVVVVGDGWLAGCVWTSIGAEERCEDSPSKVPSTTAVPEKCGAGFCTRALGVYVYAILSRPWRVLCDEPRLCVDLRSERRGARMRAV